MASRRGRLPRLVRALRRRGCLQWEEPAPRQELSGLAVRRLGTSGPPVALVHGLFSSGRYFGAAYDALAAEFQLIVPDLPGFGRSTAADGPAELHVYGDSLARCLVELTGNEPAVVVGHSFGCLVAIDVAHRYPALVAALVLFGPPVYRDRASTHEYLTGLGLAERLAMTCSPVFHHVHTMLGRLHPDVASLARPDLPPAIVADALRSDWHAHCEAVACLLMNGCTQALRTTCVPVTIVYGKRDPIPDRGLLEEITRGRPGMSIVVVPGADHHLLLTRIDVCLSIIQSSCAGGAALALTVTAPSGDARCRRLIRDSSP